MGLFLLRSSVRLRQTPKKNGNSNLHEFDLHRPSSKGTKLLFQVIKAIINQGRVQLFEPKGSCWGCVRGCIPVNAQRAQQDGVSLLNWNPTWGLRLRLFQSQLSKTGIFGLHTIAYVHKILKLGTVRCARISLVAENAGKTLIATTRGRSRTDSLPLISKKNRKTSFSDSKTVI